MLAGPGPSPEEVCRHVHVHWKEEIFTLPWLRYGQLVEGMGADKRFAVWWVTVFHMSRQIFHRTGRIWAWRLLLGNRRGGVIALCLRIPARARR